MNSRVLVIIQARMASKRFPGKVLAPLIGQPMLLWSLDRISQMKTPHDLIVASPNTIEDRAINQLCTKHGYAHASINGDENDVLQRYYVVANHYQYATDIVRVTGDCPLVCADVIDGIIAHHRQSGSAHTGISLEWGDGLDVEVFSRSSLESAHANATLPSEREHVTPYIYNHPEIFRLSTYPCPFDLSWMRLSVDTEEDLWLAEQILCRCLRRFGHSFSWREILQITRDVSGVREVMEGRPHNQSYVNQVSAERGMPTSWPQARYHGEF